MQKTINKINQLTGKTYQIKRTMNNGFQLISPELIAVVGGPYGAGEHEFKRSLKALLSGVLAGRRPEVK